MGLCQLEAQEREFSVTLHSPCICRLTLACILRENSARCTNNADNFLHWLAQPQCSSSGFSSRLSNFCWLWHSLGSPLKADRSPLPSAVNCLSASSFANSPSLGSFSNCPSGFSRTCLSSPTCGLVRDLELRPLFGFAPKQIVWLAHTLCSVTNRTLHKLSKPKKGIARKLIKF